MGPEGVPDLERLEALVESLSALDLSIDAEADRLRVEAARLAGEYLAPRLHGPGEPKVVCVAGASGVGKSSIVNALAGRRITDTGDRRPTTTEPLSWVDDRLPVTLDALRSRVPGWVADTPSRPPPGVVVVDTPPPDVVGADDTPVAHHVLAAADACILVVSAPRYADASGFDLAERARRRGLPLFFVLNRLPPDASLSGPITDDLAARLRGRGLLDGHGDEQVYTITEQPGRGEGVPAEAVGGLWDWIAARGDDDPTRAPGVSGSAAALESVLSRLGPLVLDAEVRRFELGALVDAAYAREADAFSSAVRAGRFAGVGDEDRGSALATAITRHAGRAARRSAERWEEAAPGLVAAHPDLYLADEGTHGRARAAVDVWAAGDLRATSSSRRVRLWPRLAVEPNPSLTWWDRRWARRHAGLADEARRSLDAATREVLARDAERFHRLLGAPPPPGFLAALRLEGPR